MGDFKLKFAQKLVVGETNLHADVAADLPDADVPPYWTPILPDALAAVREGERQPSPATVRVAVAVTGARQVVTSALAAAPQYFRKMR